MVQKYPSMNSTFFVNEWNGKSILGHMVQTNQLNDRKICMNCIIQKYPSMNSTFFVNEWNGKSILGHMLQTNQLND